MGNNIVYSTDGGRRPKDGKNESQKPPPAGDGVVRLQRQTKGRNGKPVILITGLAMDLSALKKLAKELKAKCGVGGSIEGHDILIQGDKRDVIKPLLESKGFTVKLAGG